jgi:hypothetical protein
MQSKRRGRVSLVAQFSNQAKFRKSASLLPGAGGLLRHLKEFGVLYALAKPTENIRVEGHHRESR